MTIKFITEEAQDLSLTFRMVEDDQFFVNSYGWLCQRSSGDACCVIAQKDGLPYSGKINCIAPDTPIQRILPKVTKIEF